MSRITVHRRLASATIIAGVVALVTGCVLYGSPPVWREAGEIPPPAFAAAAPSGASAASPPLEVRGPGGWRVSVVPVAATAVGELALPEDARSSGWWVLGAPAGAAQGTTLVAGHVDTLSGLGAFATLHTLQLGARIKLIGANQRVYPYVVTARRTYTQQALPRDLFTRDGVHRLVLVTCTGAYDRSAGRYDSNLVLYATPTGPDGHAAQLR